MTQHYIGFNRGLEGFLYNDFTVGTSTGSTDMEFRFDDTKSLNRKDLYKFLCALERFINSNEFMSTLANIPPNL